MTNLEAPAAAGGSHTIFCTQLGIAGTINFGVEAVASSFPLFLFVSVDLFKKHSTSQIRVITVLSTF